jgi:transcriptional regulator GlxA family with amidase domain
VHYGLVLFPGFELLDTFGPLEFFHTLANTHPAELHILASTLEPVSTRRASEKNTKFVQKVLPTHTFADPPPQLDVVLVPGGWGTYDPNEDAVAFIRDTYPRLKYILSVCTGASFLRRAGLLAGRRATTNKAVWNTETSDSPEVDWQPVARWVADGNVWTASGVAAGMDMTLAFIAETYGLDVAERVANGSEYDWHRDASWDPFAAIFKVPGS